MTRRRAIVTDVSGDPVNLAGVASVPMYRIAGVKVSALLEGIRGEYRVDLDWEGEPPQVGETITVTVERGLGINIGEPVLTVDADGITSIRWDDPTAQAAVVSREYLERCVEIYNAEARRQKEPRPL